MRWTPLTSAMGCLLLASTAWAGTVRVEGGVPVRWPEPLITYYLQQAGSDDLEPEDALEAVRKGFTSWDEVTCSPLTFEELGDAPDPTVTILAGASPNLQNEVVWIEDDHWTMGGYVLGVTSPVSEGDGVLVEADIAFNGLHITWKTGGGKGTDLESVAVHEIGHMFGGQHNLGPYAPDVEWPTMHPTILPKKRSRTLEADDEISVCFLYPEEDAYPCTTNADCPYIMHHDNQGEEYYGGQFLCDEDTLTCGELHYYPTNVSELGEYCEHSSSCVDDLFCLPWLGEGLCTTYCVVEDAECPETFYCAAFQSWPEFGACLPTDGVIEPPSGVLPGCTSGFDCPEGILCLPTPEGDAKVCTALCTAADPVECDETEFCHVYQAGGATGGCFPIPGLEVEPDAQADASGDAESSTDSDVGPEPDSAVPAAEEDDAAQDDAGADATAPTEETSEEEETPAVRPVPSPDPSAARPAGGCEGGPGGGHLGWVALGLLTLGLSRRRRQEV